MFERIRGSYDDTLYKSTYALLLLDFIAAHWRYLTLLGELLAVTDCCRTRLS